MDDKLKEVESVYLKIVKLENFKRVIRKMNNRYYNEYQEWKKR